jgi:hypothetical protein
MSQDSQLLAITQAINFNFVGTCYNKETADRFWGVSPPSRHPPTMQELLSKSEMPKVEIRMRIKEAVCVG